MGSASLAPSMAAPARRSPPTVIGWAMAHPNLTAFVLYTVLAIVFFLPGLLPGHTTSGADYLWSAAPWNTSVPQGIPLRATHPVIYGANPVLVDPVTVFEPFLQYTRTQLPHIPLWDPYIMGGAPYLADMQSAIFSPFSLPAYVLPFWWSLSVIAVLKVLVGCMGAFLLGRVFKMRFAGALLCGAVYGFGLFLVVWLAWPLTNVFPLIPWMLVATERVIRRPGPLAIVGLAGVVALQFFGGHPESSFDALVATVAFFVLRVLQEPGGVGAAVSGAGGRGESRTRVLVRTGWRPCVAFVIAVGLGTALAAVAILPFVELLHQSSDLTSRPRGAVSVPAHWYFSALLPNYFPGVFKMLTGFYAGAFSLVLAIIALFRIRAERIAVAVFAAVCILVVLGIQPVFGAIVHLPGFRDTYNTRLSILYLLGVALLAGWGLDDLTQRRPKGRQAVVFTGLAVALLAFPIILVLATGAVSGRLFSRAFEVAWGFAPSPSLSQAQALPIIRLSALIIWIVFAGVAALLLYARIRLGLGATAFAVLTVLVILADLFRAGMGFNPAIPDSQAQQPVTAAIRYLQHEGLARFVGVEPIVGINPLPPDVNLRYDLYDARGYDFPVIARFGEMWTRYVAPPTPLLPLDTTTVPYYNLATDPATLRILSLLGVRNIMLEKGEPTLHLPGVRVGYNGSDATIYTNDNALPRAWVVSGQDVVSDDAQALTTIGSAAFDPRQQVVTDTPLPGITKGAVSAAPGATSITTYDSQRVAVRVDAKRTSELVLSDTWYPGWQATVDGHSVPIDRVDYTLRGVAIPPGRHQVVFTYAPASFRTGWVVSLGAAIIWLVELALGLRRAPRPGRRGRRPSGRGRHVMPAGGSQAVTHPRL